MRSYQTDYFPFVAGIVSYVKTKREAKLREDMGHTETFALPGGVYVITLTDRSSNRFSEKIAIR